MIKVFTFVGENGQEFYLQFPTDFGSASYTGKVYRPGCTGLVEALKVDLAKAKEVDPRPFIGDDNIHDIQCLQGTLPPPRPGTFADWCMKADLTPAQETTVKALLDQTPGAAAVLGDRAGCANAEAFLMAVKSLSLAGSGLTDIQPVSVLTNLESLILSDNQIVETAPLEKLTKLTFLDLSRNKVSNISALALMSGLLELDISANRISRFASVGLESLFDTVDPCQQSNCRRVSAALPASAYGFRFVEQSAQCGRSDAAYRP